MEIDYSLPEAPKLKDRKKNYFYMYKGGKRFWNGSQFLCEHIKQKSRCTICGGMGFCEHNKEEKIAENVEKFIFVSIIRKKNSCSKCRGSAICIHGRRKQYCKDCGGASICIHNRQKYHCKDCGGKGICEHQKPRWKMQDLQTFQEF